MGKYIFLSNITLCHKNITSKSRKIPFKWRIMNSRKLDFLYIHHEYYKELLSGKWLERDVEKESIDSDVEGEKHFD